MFAVHFFPTSAAGGEGGKVERIDSVKIEFYTIAWGRSVMVFSRWYCSVSVVTVCPPFVDLLCVSINMKNNHNNACNGRLNTNK
jgi:hypothetical protein